MIPPICPFCESKRDRRGKFKYLYTRGGFPREGVSLVQNVQNESKVSMKLFLKSLL